ncbi:MAG: hypothetical protein AAF740_06665 [Bacteroidota bacterium]
MKTFLLHLVLIFAIQSVVFSQISRKEAMQDLGFLVGEWVGTSRTFEGDSVLTKVPAFEKISYKVDQHILTIDLHSETLQLHTVIYFDEKDQTYYYNPFYKGGAGKYPAQLKDGKLIVSPSDEKRFIFQRTKDGKFKEYGEKLENGKWIKYFEDIFIEAS